MRARHLGPSLNNLDVEVFNIGGFSTQGDFALDTDASFLALLEHRLVLARARSEVARLGRAGLSSFWSPACQDSGHGGHAGVGVVSLRGAPLSLPSFATASYSSFHTQGRVIRCCLPAGFDLFRGGLRVPRRCL